MQNEKKILGFAGIYSYDLIFYLAVFLSALDKKVLLVDNAPYKALSDCMPIPKGMEEDILSCSERLELCKDTEIESVYDEYDYILIDFGMNLNHKDILHSDYRFLVTDTRIHNLNALKAFSKNNQDYYLLVRDIVKGINETYLPMLLEHKGLRGKKNYYLYLNETDIEAGSVLQYYHSFNYKKLSPEIKLLLKELLFEIRITDLKAIKEATKKIRKGGI
ncbi:hypothetical protein R2R35_20270 [Anaerocolumna sp. AGMB13020]|uniref:hypothetical protein n=1 Tax=Anaerocolumna sp. AGMB13020 TaxID=3081750 RepID=UPI0029555E55|nr:hypothetical protein [Anaerocolumna sp. AGMB13020]WOO36110.1 hypothetical protein R2R35_20270 [Anaerocolumna sp. AGMB13020]